ncbi:MAG: GrpB family protein [Anaerolineaceae bacterium]
MRGEIVVADYDPAWARAFAEEKQRIQTAIGETLTGIEHVGSTAVPGLAAKPVIDLLVGIRSLADAPRCVAPLAALGYRYIPEYEADLPERRYFQRQNAEGEHTHHIHMVEPGSEFWRRHLLFRDYLRAHPETAVEYAALKRALAAQYRSDRAGYTDAKSDFIARVMAQAEKAFSAKKREKS